MGWRDRDWAQFTDDERKMYFGVGQGQSTPASRPARKLGETVLALAVVACLGAVAVGYVYDRVALTSTLRLPIVPAKPSYTAGVVPAITVMALPPGGVVTIRWRATDRRPAVSPGHICVSDQQQGQFCADFVAGERPADRLTRHIESLGFRVNSSG